MPFSSVLSGMPPLTSLVVIMVFILPYTFILVATIALACKSYHDYNPPESRAKGEITGLDKLQQDALERFITGSYYTSHRWQKRWRTDHQVRFVNWRKKCHVSPQDIEWPPFRHCRHKARYDEVMGYWVCRHCLKELYHEARLTREEMVQECDYWLLSVSQYEMPDGVEKPLFKVANWIAMVLEDMIDEMD